ncbi:MAG: sigma-70 family RNA polymerase sigma factor [Anaerolineaceae bacterium]|nr:sigma-70 family RNA polymerase sigma factor [Anaerolineaceae bacterium]
MNIDEKEVLKQIQQGDSDAFTYIVETYQTPVHNLCYRMLGNGQEAEDAAQETFWRAYQSINRYDPNRSFITWLLSIAAHYCIDQQRKKKLLTFDIDLLPEGNVPDLTPQPEKIFSQKEEGKKVQALLSSLKPIDRTAIVLKYWYDFSEKEISQTLDISVSAVKSRLFRARQLLSKQWQFPKTEEVKAGGVFHESPTI